MDYSVKNIYGQIKNPYAFVEVPGSKSITARAFLLSAAADGESEICGAQFSDDCNTFLNCLVGLGIGVKVCGNTVKIMGCGGKLLKKSAKINVGSAGTAARFLPAFLAFQKGEYRLDCSEQMRLRPLAPLIKALQKLGARFDFEKEEYSYPFTVYGTDVPCGETEADITESSQFLSALLISSVCAGREIKIKTNGSHGLDYVNITLDMMRSFGVNAVVKDGCYFVKGRYRPLRYEIEPDVSAACYFYAANKILGTKVSVKGIDGQSIQGDMKFIGLLQGFDGGRIDMGGFSDQALTLAAIAPYFSEPTEICGIAHIRKQECDRINAISRNLAAMGVKCEEFDGGVKIYPSQPKPAVIDTFGDHRVAMSFALTGLRADGIVIKNAEVCSKTFKNYFEVLDRMCGKLLKDGV